MQTNRPRTLDLTKILTRRELAAVLADLHRKAPRSGRDCREEIKYLW